MWCRPAVAEVREKATTAARMTCAVQTDVARPIVGQGPDTGDTGLLSDTQLCCQWGSTAAKSWQNDTCLAMQAASGGLKDKVWGFHQKYWGCVAPGTKTTPKGNWTKACDSLADDAAALADSFFTAHDASLSPCASALSVVSSAAAKCSDSGLEPKSQQQMWDDWNAVAFGSVLKGKKAAAACIAAKFKPGCASQ